MSDPTHYAMQFNHRNERERTFIDRYPDFLRESALSDMEKMMNFSLYAPREQFARLLFRQELFGHVAQRHGHIIECGVLYGQGLMTFAQLSAVLEPQNHTRRVVGFDTFGGISRRHEKDDSPVTTKATALGAMAADSYDELHRCVAMYDANRPLGHLPRVELVRGDIVETAPKYVRDNPHLVISMLYLNCNMYEPTKAAIDAFLPRMVKGSVLAFGELGHPECPGETLAVLETIGLRALEVRRVYYDSTRSYAILE